MSKVIFNDGLNAVIDALVNGDDIQIGQVEFSTDGNDPVKTDNGVTNVVATETTTNSRPTTGDGLFEVTLSETSAADGETLRKVGLVIDPGGDDIAFGAIRFADEVKENGEELKWEITVEQRNA